MNIVTLSAVRILAGVVCFASIGQAQPAPASVAALSPSSTAATLRVAAVQMRSGTNLAANVAKVKKYLADCAARNVQIVAFPECAVSSYFPETIVTFSASELAAAETEIANACGEYRIAAIVGIAESRDDHRLNCALIIDAGGKIIARYYKAQLIAKDREWKCIPGSGVPPVFTVGSAQATVMICHDSRFPELCRLPVLAGARVVFYISHENPLYQESKLVPYRALVQARALENKIFVVHANAPADDLRRGSHGHSQIVAPDGNLIREASPTEEDVLIADLDLSQATAAIALQTLQGPMGEWWREGLKHVQIIK